ncbi:MAG TPA: hypothetical protein VGR69_08520 [Candidatus Rubrimentiphilum sp.]|nr:hypothetical protein [Candidatus Rubrimentiphilum sp.]
MNAFDIVHYLTIMVAIGVAVAVFGIFYRTSEGDKLWNAGLLVAVLGVFAQEVVLHAAPWPLPALVTGLIAVLLLIRLTRKTRTFMQPVSDYWKSRSSSTSH